MITGEFYVRNWRKNVIAIAVLGGCLSPAMAQTSKGNDVKGSPAGPAPERNIAGVWQVGELGKGATTVVATTGKEVSAMTSWGQAQFDGNKPGYGPRSVPVGLETDPLKVCDPLGFPRNILYEMRAVEFVQAPDRVVELFQYQHVWREIFTDGRELPKDIGGNSADSPDPRYYGYSVGKWEGGDTFVVDTIGLDESTWLDEYGDPHSGELHVQERYHRVNSQTMELSVTIDDPKAYTKPFVALSKAVLTLKPKMTLPEQLCIPSQALNYIKLVADPASGVNSK